MGEDIRVIWSGGAILGEGPVWDPRARTLWFVDIMGCKLHRYDPGGGSVRSWTAPARIGWAVPAEGGGLVAGLKTGLARFDPEAGRFRHLAEVEPERPGNRLNDATVGPDGAIWFGSMDDAERDVTGRVYRFDGRRVEAAAIAPCIVTNGPALSPDGGTLYHVDSANRAIYAISVAPDGRAGAARLVVRIDPADGYPDGVSVDAAGNIWVGLWEGWCARLYAPDGTLLRAVRLPVSKVTKVALGGPELMTAYVTTARIGLDDAALAAQPEAGSLFAFDVEVPGLALPLARLDQPTDVPRSGPVVRAPHKA